MSVACIIVMLNLSFARKRPVENNERVSKFLLLSPKERMERIRNAIIKYGPLNRYDYQYGSDE